MSASLLQAAIPLVARNRLPPVKTTEMSSSSSKGRLADLFYETETEYYGLPPFGLLDEIGESVVNAVLSMFERVPKSLTQQIDFLSAAQIDSGSEQWAGSVEQSISKAFELFENYCLKNVLVVPEAFVLPHRAIVAHESLEGSSSDILDSEVAQLMAELQQEKLKQHRLKMQQSRLTQEEEVLANIENQLEALQNVLRNHSINSLPVSLETINKQVESLKSIVQDTIDASCNAFALDEDEDLSALQSGSLTSPEASMMDCEFPMDANMMSKLLELELKSCAAIGTLSDIKSLL